MTFYDELPIRMNPVDIKIAQVRMSDTIVDPVYKEVIGKESRNTISLQAQNRMMKQNRRRASSTGDETITAGYLVLSKKYINEQSFDFKKGDKIVEIAGDTTDYDILEVRSESALGGKNLLVYLVYGRARERATK